MSLFQTILASIENPDHAGSSQDLHGLLNLAQMLPGVQGAQQQLQPILGVLDPTSRTRSMSSSKPMARLQFNKPSRVSPSRALEFRKSSIFSVRTVSTA